jgi:hypothetical protein
MAELGASVWVGACEGTAESRRVLPRTRDRGSPGWRTPKQAKSWMAPAPHHDDGVRSIRLP